LFSVIITGFIASLWHLVVPEITLIRGLIIGLVMGIFPLFGDLGISMIKRQFGLKDTSNIIPGHGGVLDRFDTTLWAVPIGFYLVSWFWLH
jgi:phosphatidate cytidylyltransferase